MDFKQRARELVAQMTLEEKVSQMLHRAGAIERLGIPSYNWWNEALHGVARAGTATMFPQAIALAATFDPDVLFKVADTTSTEARAKYHAYQSEGDHDIYKGLTFWSPNINMFRDPRWGRGHETYGEDPHLTTRLGVSFINGLQGDDPNALKVAACAKHYAVHSGPESERHSFNAVCNDYDLWNTYLPHFEATVKEAKVEAVMGAYNRTLGEPCCGSKLLMVDILRGKWGFDGHYVSDCWAVEDFYKNHKITDSPVDSVALAVTMGCDLCCGDIYALAVTAVQEGKLSEKDVDQAVERLLVARMRLGLLGAPERPEYVNIPYDVVDSDEHNAINLEVSRRAPVLLKNDGTLPLDFAKLSSIAVIGPNADSRRALEGNYQGTATRFVTVLEGVRKIAAEHNVMVRYAQGCHLYKNRTSNLSFEDNLISEARIAAKTSDAIILCMGLDADIEGEEGDTGNEFSSGDKNDLYLPGRQQYLVEQVVEAAAGKPVILVLISGSALAVTWADTHVNGILQAFYPGALGGQVIAEIIAGITNPAGKLPVTFYKSTAELPDFRSYDMTNRTYRYFTGEPLYPFGFGLSYTKFDISGLVATKESCKVTVKNTGERAGYEVVQVYVKSPWQKEIHALCGVASVYLEPGQAKEVSVPISKTAFSRWDANGDLYPINGPHMLYVGFTQPDKRSVALYGAAGLTAEV